VGLSEQGAIGRQQGIKTLLNGLIALAEGQPPLSHGLVRSDR